MKHGDRPAAGFRGEDGEARSLKAKGKSVKQLPRNAKNQDLNVDGKKVEVKSVKETSYPGSDGYPIRGYVFSNMKTNPGADKYILRCLSPDRKKVVKKYEIPASKVKQRTLTITRNSKYEGFRKAAFLDHTQPSRVGDSPFKGRGKKEPFRAGFRRLGYSLAGRAVGALVGAGPSASLELAKASVGMKADMSKVNFKNLLGLAIGQQVGSNIGTALEVSTRRTNEQERVYKERPRPTGERIYSAGNGGPYRGSSGGNPRNPARW